ncbi:MAG: hypothetical protein AAGA36_13205 [Pseudomonadota bacterium]
MNPAALFGSLGLHVLIVLVLSVTLPIMRAPEIFDVPQIIAVDVVAISDQTVVKSPPPEESPEEAEEAPPVLQKKAEKPPEEPAPPEPTQKEEVVQSAPEPEPEPVPEPEPEPEKQAEVEKPEEKPVDEKETLADLARLIDRSKEEEATTQDLENDLFAAFGKKRIASTSRDSREESLSLTDAARAQVAKCWNLPLGAKGIEKMRVTVNVLLGPDGNLVGAPTLDSYDQRRMNRSGEAAFNAFALSAMRAVQKCAPYELPQARYAEWKALRLNFDPSQMVN